MRLWRAFVVLMFCGLPQALHADDGCAGANQCGDMRTCAEAYFYLTSCGLTDLDRNNNGIPCEKLCGKTTASMAARIKAQPYGGAPVSTLLSTADPEMAPEYQCGSKRVCREMSTCEEATYFLKTCGVRSLDGNGDGVPCNSLCRN